MHSIGMCNCIEGNLGAVGKNTQATSHSSRDTEKVWTEACTEYKDECFGTRKTIGVKEVHLITNDLAVRRR